MRWLEKANGRRHATMKEAPRLRFERDERSLLLPLAERPYRSLVLPPLKEAEAPEGRSASVLHLAIPHVVVEKRPLSVYAAVAGGEL